MTVRTFCRDCRREFAVIREWDGETCPACGSPGVAQLQYLPATRGADLPRDAYGWPMHVETAADPIFAGAQTSPLLITVDDSGDYDYAAITG